MKKSILILFIIIQTSLFSQTSIDSLKIALINASESERTEIIDKFYYSTDSMSSSFDFFNFAIEHFKNSKNKAKEIFYQIKNAEKLTENYYSSKAYLLLDSCLNLSISNNIDSLIALSYYTIAASYYFESDYQNAIENFYSSVTVYEKLKDTLNIINTYNTIANALCDYKNFEKAIEIFKSTFELAKSNPKYLKESIYLINNIGFALDGLGENSEALKYYLEYYEYVKIYGDIEDKILAAYNIGDSYRIIEDYDKALEFTNTAIELSQLNNLEYYYILSLANLAEIYNQINETSKSIKILEEIYNKVLTSNDNYFITFYLDLLGKVYYKLGNYKESADAYKFYIQFSDSVFSADTKMQIAEFEAKYQNEKKEQKILLLEKNEQIKNEQIKQQKNLRNSFIIGFILMLLLAFTVFIAFKIKKKDNNLLAIKNNEIYLQKEEILTQNEILQQQKEEILTQNENLEFANNEIKTQNVEIQKSHKQITASITYASRIQKALLPSKSIIDTVFTENFIFLKPRDIVSGDFYYCKKINEFFIIAAADCTGHGVPGAFMSMLGISFLNEIVTKREISQASQVLDELRIQIKTSLGQTGERGENQDGMDIALCVINTQNLKSQFAGANNPLYVVRSSDLGVMDENNSSLITNNS